MAGFFGFFDYGSPGRGVDKDAPEKPPFLLFFQLVWRKFSRLILLNLIYFAMLLPILTGAYFMLYGYLISLFTQAGAADSSGIGLPLLPGTMLTIARSLPAWLAAMLLLLSIVFYGPATCGLTFILRNFARQEHADNTDFFVQLKRNFKQGLALGLMDLTLLCLFAFDLTYASGGVFSALAVIRYLSWALFLIYLFMRNYFFVMTVTFRFTIRQILKNAFLLAGLGWRRNLLALALNAGLFILVLFVWQFAELVLVPALLFSFTGFISVFVCAPVVNRYLIDHCVSDHKDV